MHEIKYNWEKNTVSDIYNERAKPIRNKISKDLSIKDKNNGLNCKLFSDDAHTVADDVNKDKENYWQWNSKKERWELSYKNANSYTQIRKFFDEVNLYKMQCLNKDEGYFKNKLPYIRMINAKLAYSQARKLITPNCCEFFTKFINSIETKEDFTVFADFFEAFIAYYKQLDNEEDKGE